jgi:CubicO group peptidase (beta-lactamase class C family)
VRARVVAAGGLVLAAATAFLVLGRESPDQVLDELLRIHGVPGGVIAWGRPGEEPRVHAAGVADRTTGDPLDPMARMRIASLTKPVTSALILDLIDGGAFTLDTPLADLLGADPALPGDVTVAQALSHTGGWDRTADGDPYFLSAPDVSSRYGVGDVSDCRDVAAGVAPTVAPGTRYIYSNVGYCWLGEVVAAAEGGYLSAVRSTFGPRFWMSQADIDVVHDAAGAEADFVVMRPEVAGSFGGLVTDAESYLAFALRPVDPRILAEPPFAWEESYYGLGWRVWRQDEEVYLTHYGSMPGTFSFVIRKPGGGAAVLLLNGAIVAHEQTAAALARLFMGMEGWQ